MNKEEFEKLKPGDKVYFYTVSTGYVQAEVESVDGSFISTVEGGVYHKDSLFRETPDKDMIFFWDI